MFRFWHYIVRSVVRHRVRTALTIFGVGVAAFIVSYLVAIFDSRSQLVAQASQTTVVVHQKDAY